VKEPRLRALAALLGLGLAGGAAFLVATKRFAVEGRSMLPAYADGDRVLVSRVAYLRSEPRVGDVVVVRQPGSGGRSDIKRIAAGPGSEAVVRGETLMLGPDEWFVLGDNADESTDSRQLGPVRRRDIIGKVVVKY
jgi:signal peptidase I